MKIVSFLIMCLFASTGFSTAEEQNAVWTYNPQGKRDPFLPLVDENGLYLTDTTLLSPDELNVSGILWDPQGKSSALINNKMVTVGESIYGFTIKNITQDSVTLYKDGNEYIIKLSQKGKVPDVNQKE